MDSMVHCLLKSKRSLVMSLSSYHSRSHASANVESRSFTVVETHPESLIDLRLNSPFDELVEYANTFNYASMDSATHGHVPAVIILIKALQEWKSTVRTLSLSYLSLSRGD